MFLENVNPKKKKERKYLEFHASSNLFLVMHTLDWSERMAWYFVKILCI